MYDELRKPKLLKHVPMIIIRALPSIYYYSKFANSNDKQTPKMIFCEHINYLKKSLLFISENLAKDLFAEVIRNFENLKDSSLNDRLSTCEESINHMAAVFSENYTGIKPQLTTIKQKLIE